MEKAHADSRSYKKLDDKMVRLGTVDPRVVWVERVEEAVGWEGEEQVLGSLVLQWVQDTEASEGNT